GHPRQRPSFPTRRSSDLEDVEAIAKLGLATAQKLQKAGAGARPDLLQAQVELNASALRVSLARQRLDTAWKLLASTVGVTELPPDRKSTRLNSSHVSISY